MHVDAGHNNNVPDDLPKDLRCPLCLYHTKHKSNMIDHIVLHRGTDALLLKEQFNIFREISFFAFLIKGISVNIRFYEAVMVLCRHVSISLFTLYVVLFTKRW